MTKHVAILVAAFLSISAYAQIKPDHQTALDAISPDSMKGHLSFIASDLLEGRNTPSRGLDIAAEYIAAQFRRAGIEPAVGKSYFQTTTWNRGAAQPPGSPAPKVRNVIGVLRGSDPKLKDTYVLVTAHYDHVGMRSEGEGDRIFNGANDDGSGTISVIEIASALAKLKTRPKRSIVFVLFYGEEKGLVGSRFYSQNPVFPLAKTVAQINLEHMGRTDDSEGARIGAASMTGFDYSDIGSTFAAAGLQLGVKVEKHPQNSDAFFGRSDNQALADVGVPAHTICTAFIYPDYHGRDDHWEKIDYANMAKIAKMVTIGTLAIADSDKEPAWNAANPKAAQYLRAWQKLRQGGSNGPRS
ncbi:MAG: M28 family peptidase [Fimbriimonadaceae bacterium]